MEINSWICIMHHGQIQLSGSMKEALFFPAKNFPIFSRIQVASGIVCSAGRMRNYVNRVFTFADIGV